ncbi:MAG: alpha-(1-_3)-arabinofuranosyltransferase [Nocardioidaceae bacterium]|nr:alpha-(1->3)-arabinofuranosyltransferase [Nocardioidaceae bacterium]MCL2613699.1 alpha-(1->3)-arabinofuranosyltransferase [Nocardioidaceae bacterium]
MQQRAADRRCTVLLWTVYAALALLTLTEKWGQTTDDTRLELTEKPAGYLASTFSLWQPGVSLGQLQNQAYGYLFPQGSYYALLHWIGVPGWVSQRLWSVLVLLVACEGVRRVARALGTGPWAAAAAGLAYGLTPRMVAELGVRSAEILPGAVLPWALLPLIHLIDGRRRPRDAALLSAAAFAFAGGVNGTATAAPAALLAIVVGWALVRRLVTWRFAVGWLALLGAVNAWWVFSLLRLGAYSPPFFDYVEDAPTTTGTSGFAETLRGASNWVDFVQVGGSPWWPAGYQLSYSPWLVLGSGLVAALGVIGLLRYRGRFRTPLLLAAAFGLLCQVAAHTAPLDGPLALGLQHLLDGALAPLRNIPKADPILRVPLAIGVGVLVDDLVRTGLRHLGGRRPVRRRPRIRPLVAAGLALCLTGGLVAMAQPIIAADTRTPGWTSIPSYWTEAADYVARQPGTTWVIPGSGFGVQTWGWTMEEPMDALAKSPWVTLSQAPLAPAATIRMLSQLESYLETGSGSPYLRYMLARIGVTRVLLRHDLDENVAQVPSSSLVSVALARSPGIHRVRSFGQLDLGPAIEVFDVQPVPGQEPKGSPHGADGYDVRDADHAVTVASSVEDGVAAVGDGLVAPGQPVVIAGTEGWRHPADVVGDGFRRRERSFGRIHDAEGNVMAADEPGRAGRVLENYPGPDGARPVVARYLGIAGVDASSSRGWASTLGEVRPEDAPWSALDGDPTTFWRPAPYLPTVGQWWQVDLGRTRPIGRITLTEPTSSMSVGSVGSWRVTAGDVSRTVKPDAEGRATVDFGGVRADRVRVAVASAPGRDASVGLAEVDIAGVHAQRTLVVPPVAESAHPAFVFSAAPEARACVTTLLGPDCDPARQHPSEEATGIDRTFTVGTAAGGGRWSVRGLVVARSDPATESLLQPLGGVSMTGSSWFGSDPTVSPRMAYDDDPATEWIADPGDRRPSLRIDLGRTRTLRRLTIVPPSGIAVRPGSARLTTPGGQRRTIDLSGVGAFAPVRTRRLTLTFSRAPGSPSGGDAPLGVGEVRLAGGHAEVPLDGAGPTGSVCGFGPTLVVDGHRVRTRVSGTIGAVTSAGQLAVHPCGSRRWRLRLAAGTHRLRLLSTAQFQPVGVSLLPAGVAPRPASRSRTLHVVSTSDNHVVLDVGPGRDAIVSAPFNVNAGWQATVGGGRRLTPITVDGWAQGWTVPSGTSGRVVLSFTPQAGYVVGLVVGLVLLALVLLAAAWVLVRRPRPAGAPHPVGSLRPWRPRRRTLTVAAVGAGVVGWVAAGPVVGVAALAGVLLGRWPRVAQAAVGVALVALAIMTSVQLAGGPRQPGTAVDLATGAALALGLASTLGRRRS